MQELKVWVLTMTHVLSKYTGGMFSYHWLLILHFSFSSPEPYWCFPVDNLSFYPISFWTVFLFHFFLWLPSILCSNLFYHLFPEPCVDSPLDSILLLSFWIFFLFHFFNFLYVLLPHSFPHLFPWAIWVLPSALIFPPHFPLNHLPLFLLLLSWHLTYFHHLLPWTTWSFFHWIAPHSCGCPVTSLTLHPSLPYFYKGSPALPHTFTLKMATALFAETLETLQQLTLLFLKAEVTH
jgi:hypothetical protein